MSRIDSPTPYLRSGWGLKNTRFIEPTTITDPILSELLEQAQHINCAIKFDQITEPELQNVGGGQNLACWKGKLADTNVFVKIVPSIAEMVSTIQQELIGILRLGEVGAGLLGIIHHPTYIGIVTNHIDGWLLAPYSKREAIPASCLNIDAASKLRAAIMDLGRQVVNKGCIGCSDLQLLVDHQVKCRIIDPSGFQFSKLKIVPSEFSQQVMKYFQQLSEHVVALTSGSGDAGR